MPSNIERVQVAEGAMRTMGELWLDECDPQANLTDILADLMHWADSGGIDFDDCLRIARGHFACEAAENS